MTDTARLCEVCGQERSMSGCFATCEATRWVIRNTAAIPIPSGPRKGEVTDYITERHTGLPLHTLVKADAERMAAVVDGTVAAAGPELKTAPWRKVGE